MHRPRQRPASSRERQREAERDLPLVDRQRDLPLAERRRGSETQTESKAEACLYQGNLIRLNSHMLVDFTMEIII